MSLSVNKSKKIMSEQVDSSKDCCSICLEAFDSKPKNRNKIFLECGHEFCLTCIIPQMKQKNSCPLCRAKIDVKEKCEINSISNYWNSMLAIN